MGLMMRLGAMAELRALADDYVRWLDFAVPRETWTIERIQRDLCERSAQRILDERSTHYIAYCFDFSLVGAHYFHTRGVEGNLVLDFFYNMQKKQPRVHTAIEIMNGSKASIDHSFFGRVMAYPGDYRGMYGTLDDTLLFRIPFGALQFDQSVLENIERGVVDERNRAILCANTQEAIGHYRRSLVDRFGDDDQVRRLASYSNQDKPLQLIVNT